MSSSMLMSLGTRAMFAAYAQLQTTSNNIANANTAGYSRQQALLGTTEGQFTGAGYFGRGVTVQTVIRATDMFLTQQAAATKSTAAADAARRDMLGQLERAFGVGASGLGDAATKMFNAFADLAIAPADLAARRAVMARLDDFALSVRSSSDQLEVLQVNAFQDVQNSAREVNQLAAEVAKLNGRIAEAMSSGHAPNDLMDQRDQVISRISEKIEVHAIANSDGMTSVFIAGGQALVLAGTANKLSAGQDEFDPARVAIAIDVAGQLTPLAAENLGGGALAGLMRFQNDDLVDARNRLGQLVSGLALAMNQQQGFGIDLAGGAGDPLFNVAAPVALPAAGNARLPDGSFVGQVSLTVTDPGALQASEYLLAPDPANAGLYTVTRLSDGHKTSGLAGGDTLDGFRIDIGSGLASGDRILLKPVSTAAANLSVALGDPRGIAAGSPMTATATAANTGTAAVRSLTVTAAPSAPYQALTLRFTSAAGAYELVDSGNAVVSSGTWIAGSPIDFNGVSLSLNGVPAMGDTFALTPTPFPAASNGNALAMDAMASRALILGQTVTDTYAQVLTEVGVRAQGATSAAETSHAVAARASETLGAKTGVNVDEEAARLIQFQQAYQAAAKMLQTAQSVMDTLLQLGG